MNNIHIIKVQNKAEYDLFFKLPWSIYNKESLWVPPILKDEKFLLTPDKHPFWQNAKREMFLAFRDNQAVGRIVALVDNAYNENAAEKCGAWGFFECLNDTEAAHALFNAAASWLKSQGMEFMRGPLNPSVNYTCGVLVHGFELEPSIMMPWNYSYYPSLMESFYMRKEQDLFAYDLHKDTILPDWLNEQLESIKQNKEFSFRVSQKATLSDDIRIMLNIFKESWANNWGFSPMSMNEAENHVKTLKSVLDPKFFVLFYYNDIPAGGMLALPNMNPLLKRLNGKIGITAPWHLWRTHKEIHTKYRLVLFGIKEQYRMMGLPLLLLNYLLEQGKKHPHFASVEGSWSLEDNNAVNDMIEDFGGTLTKRYRIYRKDLI